MYAQTPFYSNSFQLNAFYCTGKAQYISRTS